jgi:hypothetical protein
MIGVGVGALLAWQATAIFAARVVLNDDYVAGIKPFQDFCDDSRST